MQATRQHNLLLFLLALAVAVQAFETPAVLVNKWSECDKHQYYHSALRPERAEGQVERLECATMHVPWLYNHQTNNTMAIQIQRLIVNDSVSTPNLWMIDMHQTNEIERLCAMAQAMEAKVNIYTIEYRPEAMNYTDASPYEATTAQKFQSQLQTLASRYGSNMAAMVSANTIAMDIASAIHLSHNPGDRVFIYSNKLATVLTKAVMQITSIQPKIDGYFLDSMAPNDISKHDQVFGQEADQFLTKWNEDATVQARFDRTSLQHRIQNLYERLDAVDNALDECVKLMDPALRSIPDTGAMPSDTMRRLLGTMLLRWELRPLVPVFVYRFRRCEAKDVDALTLFLQHARVLPVDELERASSRLQWLWRALMVSELWEVPTPSKEELMTRFRSATISDGRFAARSEEFQVFLNNSTETTWSFERQQKTNATYATDARVVVWSPLANPNAPIASANSFLSSVNTTENKKIVIVSKAQSGLQLKTSDGYDAGDYNERLQRTRLLGYEDAESEAHDLKRILLDFVLYNTTAMEWMMQKTNVTTKTHLMIRPQTYYNAINAREMLQSYPASSIDPLLLKHEELLTNVSTLEVDASLDAVNPLAAIWMGIEGDAYDGDLAGKITRRYVCYALMGVMVLAMIVLVYGHGITYYRRKRKQLTVTSEQDYNKMASSAA